MISRKVAGGDFLFVDEDGNAVFLSGTEAAKAIAETGSTHPEASGLDPCGCPLLGTDDGMGACSRRCAAIDITGRSMGDDVPPRMTVRCRQLEVWLADFPLEEGADA